MKKHILQLTSMILLLAGNTIAIGKTVATEILSRGGVYTITGEVNSPGTYEIPDEKEYFYVHDAIVKAVFTKYANKSNVLLIRYDSVKNKDMLYMIDLMGDYWTRYYEWDMPIQSSDKIIVSRKNGVNQVFVTGEVNAPGLYDIPKGRKFRISEAIQAAGGFTKSANTLKVKLIRANPKQPVDKTEYTSRVTHVSANPKDRGQHMIIYVTEIILNKGNFKDDPILEPYDIVKIEADFTDSTIFEPMVKLQNRLSKDIRSSYGYKNRIIIVKPLDSEIAPEVSVIFEEDIVLQLDQVVNIRNLMTSSIEGLKSEDVTIIEENK